MKIGLSWHTKAYRNNLRGYRRGRLKSDFWSVSLFMFAMVVKKSCNINNLKILESFGSLKMLLCKYLNNELCVIYYMQYN